MKSKFKERKKPERKIKIEEEYDENSSNDEGAKKAHLLPRGGSGTFVPDHLKDVICWKCGQKGHFQRWCSQNMANQFQKTRICLIHGQCNHDTNFCKDVQKQIAMMNLQNMYQQNMMNFQNNPFGAWQQQQFYGNRPKFKTKPQDLYSN